MCSVQAGEVDKLHTWNYMLYVVPGADGHFASAKDRHIVYCIYLNSTHFLD